MERTELADRVERLRVIAVEMDAMVRDVGPKLIRLAHMRDEARQIREEIGAEQGG